MQYKDQQNIKVIYATKFIKYLQNIEMMTKVRTLSNNSNF